ncbi:MAG: UDP-3-O-(3-hydroxymyristoyl)glucosamine N-acyltransferase [Bacteroidaceae bacterium]|nr:UDP-3-O-(3-hydroxymyristoyl)glucosamine N-acyltransferase [Bacteroidaceae bacterium]MBO7168414.1 UDP-3-O-(3-hydroxymyristoyl)glucosamine N-acyltransferase [Bacteroidaceae bacterium]MBQ5679931.1 UDP-3-O-(3-hydroxymyristoyl)glucosamine N-acyltransferase [Bacteroidaceae bacterium]MBQ5712989.1 UDP-3-O-(3-hydroxymyristoyl)glucosamine N-acyltransferase [Bacteroidaceae bacterium]MBR0543538.1 UDP-3-O-(3-hydroxymyristoyl)glucosamine N-acyltransferase [Bacteroidaceae bacterium]
MEFTAQMIAGLIGGTVVGDPEAKVNNFAKIEEGKPGCISFLYNDKYEHYIYTTESSVVLVNQNFEPKQDIKATLIKVADAREAVTKLLQLYESMKPKREGISELAFIDPTAKIGEKCYIGPFVAIAEGVEIGDGCVLHPHVTVGRNAKVGSNTEIYSNAVIYHDCRVGNRCILHAGCVIGADGFGFQPTETGYEKIPQIGIAIIEDDVEIGANTCIDRAVMGATIVHSGVKLDNLVQIAHNDEIGSHTVMSAQVGIAGSTKVGEWCMFGGQVGIAGHANIANRVMVGAQAGIPNDVKKEGAALQGSPAIEVRNFWKSSAIVKNLPEMWAEMNQMRKEIKMLKEQLNLK